MNDQERDQLSTADLAYGRDGSSQDDSSISKAGEESKDPAQLLPSETTSAYKQRWTSVQVDFVDKPQESVREADSLVAEVIQELAHSFAEQREQLEGQWSRGDDVSTEELRQALQQYRSFFQRLLAA